MDGTCRVCGAAITLPGDYQPKVCTDVDPAKNCRDVLRAQRDQQQHQRSAFEQAKRSGTIVTCEWDDCRHQWPLRGVSVSYCPRCNRPPMSVQQNKKKTGRPPTLVKDELPFCHQCGSTKSSYRIPCDACRKQAPNTTHRVGITLAKWHDMLTIISKIARVAPKWRNVLEAIYDALESDRQERQWMSDVIGFTPSGKLIEEPETVLDSSIGPDEVELSVDDALTLIRGVKALPRRVDPDDGPYPVTSIPNFGPDQMASP